MTSHHILCLALISNCLLSPLPCMAQAETSVTLKFLSFPSIDSPTPVELLVGEGKTLKVEIPTNELSVPYQVKSQSAWVIGETVKGKDDKPAFTVFGQAPSPASNDQLILLIRKGKSNADGFTVVPINSVKTEFGGGKFLFVNAASVDIAGVVGTEKFMIKPGTHSIIQPKGDAKNKTLCQTEIFFNKDNQAKPFFSSTWPLSDDARGLIFFYHDSETKRLRLHSIRDFP